MSEDINKKLEDIFKSSIFINGHTYLLPTNVEFSNNIVNRLVINVNFEVFNSDLISKDDYILVPVKDIKKIE